MEQACTHITVILDRTGSMESIKDDVIGGFNSFLETQRATPGRATLTLVQFDSQDPFEVVYSRKDINDAPPLTAASYIPRASTPLLDALGRGMADLDAAIAVSSADTRPDKVIFAVVTDGMENASREFSRAAIQQMIAERKARGWQFVFLSADLDAVEEARHLGFSEKQRRLYEKETPGVQRMFRDMSVAVNDYRSGRRREVELPDEEENA